MPASQTKITRRGELVKLTRELGIDRPECELKQLLDDALATPDPVAFIRRSIGALPPVLGQTAAAAVPAEQPADGCPDVERAAPIETPAAAAAESPPSWNLTLPLPPLASVPPRNFLNLKLNFELHRFPLARATLARLRGHLESSGATLAGGKKVRSADAALVWLLEQLGQAAELGELL